MTMLAPTTPQQSATADLPRALVGGVAWTGAVRTGAQALTWVSTLVVARLLSPDDYGLVAMAMAYLGLLLLVNEFGLGAAIVQRRDMDDGQVARIGGLGLSLGLLLCLASALAARPVARFLGEPMAGGVIVVGGLTFVLSALQLVPRSLLARALDFRRLALTDGAEAVVSASCTVTLAGLGWGYWALVLGPLVGRSVGVGLLWRWRAHRIAWPWRGSPIANAVRFGGHLTGGRIAWYWYTNADFVVLGKLLGSATLGAYAVGWSIANAPLERVTVLVGSVTAPIFAAAQHDHAALRRLIRHVSAAIALVTFPAAIGLALVADDLVVVALGEPWRVAGAPLRILALSTALRSVTPILAQVPIAMGETRQTMHRTLIAAVILPPLFIFGAQWGATGVAAVWLIGHPLLLLPLVLQHVMRLTGLRLSDYARSLTPAAMLSAAMAAVVLGLQHTVLEHAGPAVRLAASSLTGAVCYAALAYLTQGARLRALRRLLAPQPAMSPATSSPCAAPRPAR